MAQKIGNIGNISVPIIYFENYDDTELKEKIKDLENKCITQEQDPTIAEYIKNISEEDINKWNNGSTFDGNYENLENKPFIPSKTSDLENDSNFVTNKSLTEELTKKQDTLIAGENITIENGVISSSGGGSGDGILTGSVIGYTGDEIPEGYEEVDTVEDLTSKLTNFNSKIVTKDVKLLKSGHVYNLYGYFQTSGETGVFTSADIVFKIPTEYIRENLPIYNTFSGAAGSVGSLGINVSGEFKFINNLSNTHWVGINISWIK